MSVLDYITGVFAPYECLGCQTEGFLLCPACAESLPATEPVALKLGTAYSVTLYQTIARDMLWKLKSSGARAAAGIMAELMAGVLPDKPYIIVSLPTATGRVRQRGYDQARLLARALARLTGLRWSDCLVRMGQTHQVGANRQARLEQLADAYRLKLSAMIKNGPVLLVDDVMTTGASLEAASRVLITSGASEVDAVTFARAELRTART